MYVASKTL